MMSDVTTWKCDVCGYVHEGAEPPANCPVCGVEREMFSPLAAPLVAPAGPPPKAWRCTICDHVHQGPEPPDECPVCGASKNLFEPVTEAAAAVGAGETGPVVVVGAGIAGVTAADRARATAPDIDITLVSSEPGLPYYRLNLTRYLAGEVGPESLPLQPESWYADRRIDLVHGEVTGIDRTARTVRLRDGRELTYRRLVLTTGSHAFVPPIEGASLGGVHVLRSAQDAVEILERVSDGARCVVIGGGLLGLEAAGALHRQGVAVTVVEGFGWLLPRQLPEPAGRLLADHLQGLGIHLAAKAKVTAIVGDDQARGVNLADGTLLEADFVVLSTGVRPNSYLARQVELKVDRGVLVDDGMFTSDPDILAAGDVAEYRGEVQGIWPTAYAQGVVAGMNAAGGATEYATLPRSNRLKVMDVDLFSIGVVATDDGSYQEWERQDSGSYIRLVSRDGRLVGGALYGDTSLAGPLKEAVESGRQLQECSELTECLPTWAASVGLSNR
jgi:NAD(P)H-nitrite reductase large subunit/rubredoxin